ncbi:hypothetical protein [Paraburkholderia pallida]|uniref:Integrase catalytic domain-containing protein n=1 Tax=Paraburkholderia pallida TaxID=2547399 RepID=A0A4P7D1D1_9BURK|nr:hypothetical protein [Paraburkholderia pallida]QBR02511.1 hypothetical protein E1956_35310 [Paraburkholderia pallida]
MADDQKLAELRSIEGAEEFSYDTSVPYDRLNDESIAVIAARSVLPEVGTALVNDVRNSPPAFGPKASRELGNIVGWFPSRTMRLIMQFASLGVQYLALLFLDSPIYNRRVLEIWNNVLIFDVEYEKTTTTHRAHALIVEPDAFLYFEYRTVEEMLKKPGLYHIVDGRWDAPKLRVAAARYGIGYRLVTDDDIGQVALGNLKDLQRCYWPNYRAPSESTLAYIAQRVEAERVVSWRSLNDEGISGDAIKCAIALGLVWYPIRDWDMSLEIAFIYADEDAYRQHREERRNLDALTAIPVPKLLPAVGDEVEVDGATYTVVRADAVFRLVCLGLDDKYATRQQAEEECRSLRWIFKDQAAGLIYQLSKKQIWEGTLTLAEFSQNREIYRWRFGVKEGSIMSDATVRRIKAKIELAKLLGISPLVTLARNHGGNPGARSFGEGFAWRKVLYNIFLTATAPTVSNIKRPYEIECEKQGQKPVSLRTLRNRLKILGEYNVVVLRKGEFAAYKYGAFVPGERVCLLVKGRYPGEVGHIDSTPFPNVAIDPFTQEPATRRLSLTIMVDANTDDVVGFVLYYGSPSYRAIYRLLRQIVNKTGQLPEFIVVDRGPEHLAKQLQVNLARFRVITLLRPVKKARAGQTVEGKFSALIRGLLKNLPGFRDPNDNYREIPASFTPKSQARLTLTEFRHKIASFFRLARTKPSAKTGSESIERFAARREFEKGPHWIAIDDINEFLFTMMPLVEDGGKRKVYEGCIRNQYVTYSHEIFLDPRVDGQDVSVREDPDNIGHVIVDLDVDKLNVPGSDLPPLPSRVIAKCAWYERYSVFTVEEREEYFEHRRKTTQLSDRTVAMSQDFELLLELEARRRTPAGAQAYAIALQNREIDVSRQSLVKLGILRPDGTVNPDFVVPPFDSSAAAGFASAADPDGSANFTEPPTATAPVEQSVRQPEQVATSKEEEVVNGSRKQRTQGAATKETARPRATPATTPVPTDLGAQEVEPNTPAEPPAKPTSEPRILDDI